MLGPLTPAKAVMGGKYGTSDMFKWRILSPVTKQYWEIVSVANNCDGIDGQPTTVTITSSLTTTTSTNSNSQQKTRSGKSGSSGSQAA